MLVSSLQREGGQRERGRGREGEDREKKREEISDVVRIESMMIDASSLELHAVYAFPSLRFRAQREPVQEKRRANKGMWLKSRPRHKHTYACACAFSLSVSLFHSLSLIHTLSLSLSKVSPGSEDEDFVLGFLDNAL